MESRKIHGGGYDLSGTARFNQTSCGAGEISAAGVGADHRVRVPSVLFLKLMAQLIPQRLYAAYPKGAVQGGVKVARFLQHQKHLVEKLRAYGKLQHLRSQGFALPGFFHDLRLAYALRVVALL